VRDILLPEESQDPISCAAVVLSFEEFCQSEFAWDELVSAAPYPVPFMSHPWLRLWWKHFGAHQEFKAIVIRQGSRLLAAVPLAFRRLKFIGRSVTLCEIVGTGPVPTRGMGLADKADLLCRTDSPQALKQLIAELAKLLEAVDIIDLKGVDGCSQTQTAIEAPEPRFGSKRLTERSSSPYLPLTGSWEEHLRGRSQRFRKNLKRSVRNLNELGDWSITRMLPEHDAEAWVEELLSVNDASWKAERGTNLFRCPEIRSFMQELVPEMAAQGWIALHMLRLTDRALTYEFCFEFHGRVFAYNASYRKLFDRLSLGMLITADVIESAFARGLEEYDMLRGAEPYKLRWSGSLRTERRAVLTARRWLSRSYACFGLQFKEQLKRSKILVSFDDRISGFVSRIRCGK